MLRWLAAVSINLGKDDLELYLEDIVSPVYRELEVVTTYKGECLASNDCTPGYLFLETV